MNKEPMSIDQLQELMNFLTEHEIPGKCRIVPLPPQMTCEQAFSLIWLLQEQYHIIPDSYRLCNRCGYMYDSYAEGFHLDPEEYMRRGEYRNYPLAKCWHGKNFHDDCLPFRVVMR